MIGFLFTTKNTTYPQKNGTTFAKSGGRCKPPPATDHRQRSAQAVKGVWRAEQLLKNLKMNKSIIELAKQCPELTVSIKVHDLVEGLNILIGNVKSELEQTISDQQAETYPSRDKVMEILGVSSATLWRWHKSGYLVPLNVGGKRRYRMSDIQKLLKGGNTVAKGGA